MIITKEMKNNLFKKKQKILEYKNIYKYEIINININLLETKSDYYKYKNIFNNILKT